MRGGDVVLQAIRWRVLLDHVLYGLLAVVRHLAPGDLEQPDLLLQCLDLLLHLLGLLILQQQFLQPPVENGNDAVHLLQLQLNLLLDFQRLVHQCRQHPLTDQIHAPLALLCRYVLRLNDLRDRLLQGDNQCLCPLQVLQLLSP